jgi:hypothetical protein
MASFRTQHGKIPIPVRYSDRAKLATQNPVATVLEYQLLIENMMSLLVGIQLTSQ